MDVARSIATQRQWASSGLYILGNISIDDDASPVFTPPKEGKEGGQMLEDEMTNTAWNDMSGKVLDLKKVIEARRA